MLTQHAKELSAGLLVGLALSFGPCSMGWDESSRKVIAILYSITLAYFGGRVAVGVIIRSFSNVMRFMDIEKECRCLATGRFRIMSLPHAAYTGLFCGLLTSLTLLSTIPPTVVPHVSNVLCFFLVMMVGLFSGTMNQRVVGDPAFAPQRTDLEDGELTLEDIDGDFNR